MGSNYEFVFIQAAEHLKMVTLMFLRGGQKHKHIVYLGKDERKSSKNAVNKSLKCPSGIANAERHVRAFEEPKTGGYRGFGHIFGGDGYLVISLFQIDRREYCHAGKACVEVSQKRRWIAVR